MIASFSTLITPKDSYEFWCFSTIIWNETKENNYCTFSITISTLYTNKNQLFKGAFKYHLTPFLGVLAPSPLILHPSYIWHYYYTFIDTMILPTLEFFTQNSKPLSFLCIYYNKAVWKQFECDVISWSFYDTGLTYHKSLMSKS